MEYRIEHDSMGEVKVPADKLWGAQTERSHENFLIGVGIETMPREITKAFGYLKKAAALANNALKPEKMTDKKLKSISQACDEVISGSLNENFPLVVWQTGSGSGRKRTFISRAQDKYASSDLKLNMLFHCSNAAIYGIIKSNTGKKRS